MRLLDGLQPWQCRDETTGDIIDGDCPEGGTGDGCPCPDLNSESEGADVLEAAFLSAIKAGRMAEPSEIAKAILFLASEDASFMTGQTLLVDGGMRV